MRSGAGWPDMFRMSSWYPAAQTAPESAVERTLTSGAGEPVIVTPVIFVPPRMPIAAPRAARAAWAWPESMELVSRLCSAATSAARSWVLRSTSLDGGGTVPSPPPPQPAIETASMHVAIP